MLSGSLTEVQFDWPQKMKNTNQTEHAHSAAEDKMKMIQETTLKENEVAYINGRFESTKDE